jgi:hypothetical protein
MEAVYTEEYQGKRIEIYRDETPPDPREWDNLGTMVCEHPHYRLGDYDCKEWYRQHGDENTVEERDEIGDTKELFLAFLEHQNVFALPLYLLDHSGLAMQTYRFAGDPGGWDTSHVGYIYVTKERFKAELGRWNQKKARKILEEEVKVYNDFLTGNVYGYIVRDSEGEHLGSCWGFFGDYDEPGGCLESAREEAK